MGLGSKWGVDANKKYEGQSFVLGTGRSASSQETPDTHLSGLPRLKTEQPEKDEADLADSLERLAKKHGRPPTLPWWRRLLQGMKTLLREIVRPW